MDGTHQNSFFSVEKELSTEEWVNETPRIMSNIERHQIQVNSRNPLLLDKGHRKSNHDFMIDSNGEYRHDFCQQSMFGVGIQNHK
jgi:hypothetical protein